MQSKRKEQRAPAAVLDPEAKADPRYKIPANFERGKKQISQLNCGSWAVQPQKGKGYGALRRGPKGKQEGQKGQSAEFLEDLKAIRRIQRIMDSGKDPRSDAPEVRGRRL